MGHHPNRSHILRISNSVTFYLVIDHEGAVKLLLVLFIDFGGWRMISRAVRRASHIMNSITYHNIEWSSEHWTYLFTKWCTNTNTLTATTMATTDDPTMTTNNYYVRMWCEVN